MNEHLQSLKNRPPEQMSFKTTIIAFIFLIHSGCSLQHTFALEPTDPDAIPQARELLQYLDGLKSKSVNRVLSGQCIDNSVENYNSQYKRAFEKYGYWSAIIQSQMYYYWTDRSGWTQRP